MASYYHVPSVADRVASSPFLQSNSDVSNRLLPITNLTSYPPFFLISQKKAANSPSSSHSRCTTAWLRVLPTRLSVIAAADFLSPASAQAGHAEVQQRRLRARNCIVAAFDASLPSKLTAVRRPSPFTELGPFTAGDTLLSIDPSQGTCCRAVVLVDANTACIFEDRPTCHLGLLSFRTVCLQSFPILSRC